MVEKEGDLSIDDFPSLRERVRDAIHRGNLTKALSDSRSIVDRFPAEPGGHLLLARVLFALKKFADAQAVLMRTWPMHEDNPKALSLMKTLAFSQGKIDESVRFALLLARLEPHDRKNLQFLVERHLDSNEHDIAFEHSQTLVEQHPGEPKSWKLKSLVLLGQDRAEEALTVVREGLSVHPGNYQLLKVGRNISLRLDDEDGALLYALQMSAIGPHDSKNQAALIQLYLRKGDFAAALTHAQALAGLSPNDPQAIATLVRCLVNEHRVEEALEAARAFLSKDASDVHFLMVARNLAYQHGRFEEAIDYAVKLAIVAPTDRKSLDFAAQTYMAAGDVEAAEKYLDAIRSNPDAPPLKTAHYLQQYKELKEQSPAIVEAWHACMRNRSGALAADTEAPQQPTTMIQYWSQGAPPEDVQLVLGNWQALFEREQLGEVKLFDRSSAAAWIEEHAPEFTRPFSHAFHFAMESDIFRIAYASKMPCIYVDIDGWPLENTAEILKFGVRSVSSMLYFRSFRPWIVNGFFISRPECPFFHELVRQTLSLDLNGMRKNHDTIERTFGPTRYNQVLLDVLAKHPRSTVSAVEGIAGCSELTLDGERIYFSHEAAVASVKPPFRLGYKTTADYWKGVSIAG